MSSQKDNVSVSPSTFNDTPVGEELLFEDEMRGRVPASLLQERHDELPACVSLGHGQSDTGRTERDGSRAGPTTHKPMLWPKAALSLNRFRLIVGEVLCFFALGGKGKAAKGQSEKPRWWKRGALALPTPFQFAKTTSGMNMEIQPTASISSAGEPSRSSTSKRFKRTSRPCPNSATSSSRSGPTKHSDCLFMARILAHPLGQIRSNPCKQFLARVGAKSAGLLWK